MGIERTQEVARQHLTELVDGVESVRRRAPFNVWVNGLRQYRNKFIAHSLDKKIQRPPVYGSIGAIF